MRLQLRALVFLLLLNTVRVSAQDQAGQVGVDMLYYVDDNNVWVASPQVSARYALDPEGGAVSARVVVDAISAASVDVVTQATPGFEEVRYEGDVSASRSFGHFTPSLGYRFSHEPDYVSHGARAGLVSRLGTPDSVLGLNYGVTNDQVQRSGTLPSVFEERLWTHSLELSYTQTLSARSVLRGAFSLTRQRGFMEKPYRHVPIFLDDATAVNANNFDLHRSSLRPLEEVPDQRSRFAIAGRWMHYFPNTHTSLRLDYRFYGDDWGVMAHTVESGLRLRLASWFQLAAAVRVYRQNGARFWRRAYVVDSLDQLPRYRSVDRDFSAYTTLTGTLRGTIFTPRVSVYLEGGVARTFYDNFLFLDSLTALIAQAGVRIGL